MIDFTNPDTFVQDALAEARRVRASKPAAPPPEPQTLDSLDPHKRDIVRAILTPNASEAKLGAEIGKRAVTRGNAALQTSEPVVAKVRPEYQDLVRGVLYTEAATPSQKTFGGEAKKNVAEKLPGVGSFVAGYNALELLDVAKKLERGEASDEDIKLLADRYEEMQGDPTISSRVGDILSNLPGTMVDFLVTGGLAKQLLVKGAQKGAGKAIAGAIEKSAARAGETAAAKAVEKATARMVERGILKAAPLEAAAGAAKYAQAGAPKLVEPGIKLAAGALTKSAIQTALMGGRAVQAGVERDVGEKLAIGQDDLGRAQVAVNESIGSLAEVLPEGLVDMWIENLSERAGGAIDAIPPLDRLGLLSTRLATKVAGASGKPVAEVLRKIGEGAGWHGVVSEMGEERFGDLARAAILGDPLELSGEQLAAEAIGFSVPGAAGAVTSRVLGRKPSREGSLHKSEGGQTAPSGTPGAGVAQETTEKPEKPASGQFPGSSAADGEAVEVEPPPEDAKAWAKAQKAGAPAGARLQAPRTDEQRAAAELLRGSGVRAYFVARPPAEPAESAETGQDATQRATEPDDGFQGVVVGNAAFLADDLPAGGAVRWVANHELVHVLEKRQGKEKFFRGLSAAVEHFPELKGRAYDAFLAAEAAAEAGPEASDEQFLGAAQKVAGDKALVRSEVPAYAVELMGDLIDAAAKNPKAAVEAVRADPGFWKSLLDAVYRVVNRFGARIDLHGHQIALDWVRAHSNMPWHQEADPRKLAAFALKAAEALGSLQVPRAERPDAAPAKAPRQSFDSELSQATVAPGADEKRARARAPAAQQPRATTQQPIVAQQSPFGGDSEAPEDSIPSRQPDAERAKAYRDYAKLQTHYQGHKGEFLRKAADVLARVDLSDVETVFDMYAGGGTYGLTYVASGATPKAKRVVVNEIDPVRRHKFELARAEGSEFVRLWESDPLLSRIKAAIAPLFTEKGNDDRRSSSPAALALKVIDERSAKQKYHEFIAFGHELAKASPRVRAAFTALRDVMFSGRTAPLERVLENARDDADNVRELVRQVEAKGVKVDLVSMDSLSDEAVSLVKSGGRSLVLLDPPYHETASGTYSAPGTSYKFSSTDFLHANAASGARMAPGNVVLYHNKATNEVVSTAARAFGRSAASLRWQRNKGGLEFLGIYDGRRQGGNARDVGRAGGAAEGTRSEGGRPRVVGEARSDSGREAERGAAADDRGAGRRLGASPAELEAAAKKLGSYERAQVAEGLPLDPGTFAEWNKQHEQSLVGMTAEDRKKTRERVRQDKKQHRHLVAASLAFPKQVGDRVRFQDEDRIGKVVDVTGPVSGRKVRVRFAEELNPDRTIRTPGREIVTSEKKLLLVERKGPTTRTQQKRASTSAEDMTQQRVRFSRRAPGPVSVELLRRSDGSAYYGASFRANGRWADITFRVDSDGEAFIGNISSTGGSNSLGAASLLEVQRQIRAQVPSIKRFSGDRIGGAKRPLFSRAQPRTAAFRRWFEGSKVVDKDGKPLVVYHGTTTPTEFSSFASSTAGSPFGKRRGIWTAEDPEEASAYAYHVPGSGRGRVFPVFLSIKNPAKVRDLSRADIERLESEGYDGALIESDAGRIWVAFSPTQVKSAMGNRGTFSKSNPDIRFSRKAPDRAKPDALGFVSAMENAVRAKMPEKASATQVLAIVSDGVKPEEVEWSGIRKFLGGRASVTKAEVLEFIAANGMRVVETKLGGEEQVYESWHDVLMTQGHRFWMPQQVIAFDEEGNEREFEALYGDEGWERESGEEEVDYTSGDGQRFVLRGSDDSGWVGYDEDDAQVTEPRDDEYDAMEDLAKVAFARWKDVHGAIEEFHGSPDYDHYQLTGPKSNYRELLLQVPGSLSNDDMSFEGKHFSSHSNVIGWVRVNDRQVDDKRMLLVEEIQSDWHQKGRKKGYYTDDIVRAAVAAREKYRAADVAVVEADRALRTKYADEMDEQSAQTMSTFNYLANYGHRDEAEKFQALLDRARDARDEWDAIKQKTRDSVPDAPFKKTWHELAFKRALAVAVEEGHDLIGWTTGAQQIDRYDEELRRNVDKIEVEPRIGEDRFRVRRRPNHGVAGQDNGFEIYDAGLGLWTGTSGYDKAALVSEVDRLNAESATNKAVDSVYVRAWKSGQEKFGAEVPLEGTARIHGHDAALEDVVGKDIANKIRAKPTEAQTFEGEGLAIGGKGMQEFYDGMLVRLAQSIAKKYGGEVGKVNIDTSQPVSMRRGEPPTGVLAGTETVHSMTISPELRTFVREVGFPRFSRRLTKAQRERVERMKAASGRAFNEGEETEVGSDPAPLASTSESPVIRAFQRGVRAERSGDHETRHIEDAIDEADAELEQHPDRAAKRVLDKAREGSALTDVETHILDRLWKESAEKWNRTQYTTDYVRAAELNELYQQARRTASLALSTIRDANMSAADRVMEIITTPGRAVGQQIRRLQKARRSMAHDDPRLARVQARLDKLLAQEAERAKKTMQRAKDAGLDPAYVTENYFADPYALARFGSDAAIDKASKWEWLIELRIADMLSGPTTQIANIAGNAGHIAFDQVARRFAEAMANTVAGDKDSPTFRENAEFARALPTALGNAARNWFMAYATELPTYERELQARGVEIDGPAARDDIGPRLPGLFGRLLRLPSLTTLLAFDEFFKTLSGEMELRALAYRAAKAQGIEHPSVEDVDRVLQTDIEAIGPEALKVARRALFQERTPLMRTLVKLRKDVDDTVGVPVGSFLFPFIQTPAQIFQRSLEVPFAIPTALVRFARGHYKDNPRLRVQDSAQVAISLGIGFAVMQMVGGDDDGPWITGSRSSNFDKADLQQRTAPPNSIKLYGKWYSYARVEPFATILATMVDQVNAVNEANKAPDATAAGTGLAAFGTLVSSLYDQAGDKTFLRTVGDLMKIREEMHRGEGKPGKQTIRFIRDTMVTPMIPFSALLRQTTGADEPEVRTNTLRQNADQGLWTAAAWSVWEGTIQRDASKPPPKFDLWGRPIKKDGRSYLGRLVGVLKQSGDPADVMDLDRLIVRWNDRVASGEVIGPDAKPWYPSPPEYAYDDRKTGRHYWSHEEYAALCERAGKLAAERLAGRTLNYETPTEKDIDTMKRVISDARASVKKQLIREAQQ